MECRIEHEGVHTFRQRFLERTIADQTGRIMQRRQIAQRLEFRHDIVIHLH